MSWVKREDCQERGTRMERRRGVFSVRVTEATAVMGVMWSRVPGSMFQASYCFGVSLKVWSWLPQALGARDSALVFASMRLVIQPVLRSIVASRRLLERTNLSVVSFTSVPFEKRVPPR